MYALFDVVLESRVLGVRKPDPRLYELACEELGVRPDESVFLDDLGVNLKPARALGMPHRSRSPTPTLRWPSSGQSSESPSPNCSRS